MVYFLEKISKNLSHLGDSKYDSFLNKNDYEIHKIKILVKISFMKMDLIKMFDSTKLLLIHNSVDDIMVVINQVARI